MTYVMRQGKHFTFIDQRDVDITEAVPPGVYTVKTNPFGEYYLDAINDFENPPKFYGNVLRNAKRIFDTYKDRGKSTGIHLDGIKGSGKTLLARTIANMAVAEGMAVIIVTFPFSGDTFNQFIQSIGERVVVIFDEFEKVYNEENQQKILTLFDGVYLQKMLFVITTNDSWKVSEFLKNRPGRVYYSLKFSTLENDFIREYCEDKLKDVSKTESVVKYSTVFDYMTFDMLQAIVEEMNRYDESIEDVMKFLNVQPQTMRSETYTVYIKYEGITRIYKDMVYFNISNPDFEVDDLRQYGIPEHLVIAAVKDAQEKQNAHYGIATDAERLEKIPNKKVKAKVKEEVEDGSESYDAGMSNSNKESDEEYDFYFDLTAAHISSIDLINKVYTFKVGDIEFVFRKRTQEDYSFWKMF